MVPAGKPTRGVRLDHSGALDPRDGRDLAPGAGAHVGLGVVEAERLDPDQYVSRRGHGVGQVGDAENLGTAVGGDGDGLHGSDSILEWWFNYWP